MDYRRIVEAVEAEAERSLAAYADEDDAYCAGFRDGVEALTRVVAEAREREERKREIAHDKAAKVLRSFVGAKLELVDEVEGEDAPWVVAKDGDVTVFATVREGMGHEPLDRDEAEGVALRWLEAHDGRADDPMRFDLLCFEAATEERAMVRCQIDCLGGAER